MNIKEISIMLGVLIMIMIIGYLNYKSIIARSQRIIEKIKESTNGNNHKDIY